MPYPEDSKPPLSPHNTDVTKLYGSSPKSIIDVLFINSNKEQNSNEYDLSTPTEADYEVNPTDLYCYIEKRDWKRAIKCCNEYPREASIYLYRKDAFNTVRWKQLPIHAALVFKGKSSLITSLIHAFPQGVKMFDDQGMLPIHLAFRYNASEAVINLLLEAYPEGINMKDKKGRIPISLTRVSKKNYEDRVPPPLTLRSYISNYDSNAAAEITEEQRKIFMTKSKDLMDLHRKEIQDIKDKFEHLETCEFKCEAYLKESLHKINAQENEIVKVKNEKNEISKDLKLSEIELKALNAQQDFERTEMENLIHQGKKEQERREKEREYFEEKQNEHKKMIAELNAEIKTFTISEKENKKIKRQNDEDLKVMASSSKILLLKVQKLESKLSIERSRYSSLQARINASGDKEDQLLNRVCELTQNLLKRSNEKKALIRKHTEETRILLEENAALRRRCLG